MKLTQSQRDSLKLAEQRYHEALPGSPASEYLNQRGLANSEQFKFGFVKDPLPEHAQHEGKLAIPYRRWHPRYGWGCVSMRFRALDGSKPKYASISGDRPRLYNTPELNRHSLVAGVCEGELDAATLTLAGLPTVGVPGSTMWKSHWAEMLRGYETVFVFSDGDEAGQRLTHEITKDLKNTKVIVFPEGEDANSILVSQGVDALRDTWQKGSK